MKRPKNWWRKKVYDHDAVVRAHLNDGRTMADIASDYGCSRERIRQIIRKYGVPVEVSAELRHADAIERNTRTCKYPPCDKTYVARGNYQYCCRAHAMIMQRTGPNYTPGFSWSNALGHYMCRDPRTGKLMRAARYIMQEHLGRALNSHEWVTHIDGDRRNLAIENLRIDTPSVVALRREVKRGRRIAR